MAQSQGNLAWYRAMEEQAEMVQVSDFAIKFIWRDERWRRYQAKSVFFSLEGADC
jgi:hypothetical protein